MNGILKSKYPTHSDHKMVTIVLVSMLAGGVLFAILDIVIKQIYFGPLHVFAGLTAILLFLHVRHRIAYSNYLSFFLFLFWISFLCLDGVDEDDTSIYFLMVISMPAITFSNKMVRYFMSLIGLIALFVVIKAPSFHGVSDREIVGIYDFVHIILCSILVFVVLNYFRDLIDSYSLSQIKLLENTNKLNNSLEKSNSELLDVKNDLVNKNEELETFVYITSHDLKSPLNSILGFQGILKEKLIQMNKYDKLAKYIDYPIESAQTLKEIIDSLLVLSRVSNKADIELSEFEILPLLQKIELEQKSLHAKGMVQIEIDTAPSVMVKSNRESLYLVVQNLVSNGINYNESPLPTIKIEVIEQDLNVTISVHDNGIGIDKQFFESIFQPFKRLGNKKGAKGTGLGLTIVKRLTAKIGTDINIDSKSGIGSTFTITLPK